MIVPIIIQTFNRISYTMQVIASIKTHILYPHYLIVIDNASTDGTVEYLELMKKLGIIQELILNKENLGIAIPKNQGVEKVHELAKTQEIKHICISDNDIVPPFIRDGNACALTKIIQIMDGHQEIGMCGVDLNRDNSPPNQEWWWRLRQHPIDNPEFAEIAIGFWFSVTRYDYLKEFKFTGESLYGRVDESYRNWLTNVKKARIGLLKGVRSKDRSETVPKTGIHLGWIEDYSKNADYVLFKKAERFKAEQAWKEKNKKW